MVRLFISLNTDTILWEQRLKAYQQKYACFLNNGLVQTLFIVLVIMLIS